MIAGVSAAVGLICLVSAGLIWTVGQKHTPRLVVVLVLVGVLGLVATPVGAWLRSAVGWVDSLTGRLTGQLTGVVITGLIGFIALYVLVAHMYRRNINGKTLLAAGVVPIAATTIPGVIGTVAVSLTTALATAVAAVVGVIF